MLRQNNYGKTIMVELKNSKMLLQCMELTQLLIKESCRQELSGIIYRKKNLKNYNLLLVFLGRDMPQAKDTGNTYEVWRD